MFVLVICFCYFFWGFCRFSVDIIVWRIVGGGEKSEEELFFLVCSLGIEVIDFSYSFIIFCFWNIELVFFRVLVS